MLGREQDGAQRKPLVAVERLVIHRDAEEPGVAEGLVRTLRLDVPAERLGPHIDAEARSAPEDGPPVSPESAVRRPVSRRALTSALPVGVFVGFEPDRAVPIFGERVEPLEHGVHRRPA